MSRKTKTTGLGTGAFFPEKLGADPSLMDSGVKESEKKMRTTIMLPPDVVAGIEALRMQARKNGTRMTTSQIIEDALNLLMRERNINI
jgi:hypothetical protein